MHVDIYRTQPCFDGFSLENSILGGAEVGFIAGVDVIGVETDVNRSGLSCTWAWWQPLAPSSSQPVCSLPHY
jgi:hypothetical protein